MEGALGHTLEFTQFARVCEAHRFDLRFFRPFRADLSIRKSSSFLPPLIAATSNEVSRHDLPKFRLTDLDISAGLSFPSKHFHRLPQPLRRQPRQTFPTAFQSRPAACEAFRQPAFAGP